jgi:2-polyprenyl-3-methyl-5-hydroxy-6-metoxy-1,4-benzoquinol methylase
LVWTVFRLLATPKFETIETGAGLSRITLTEWGHPLDLTQVTKDNLDDFVREVDHIGGPDAADVAIAARNFHYRPTVRVDQAFDPYSDQYWQQQTDLYREITGREINQRDNELTEFALEEHVRALNSYASADPTRMALHHSRLGKLIKHASLPNSARVLDLGCGWGLSSEIFATMGCRVTAVDINQKFVELVARRSARLDLGIEVINSNFDDLHLDKQFDLIVFYECLHHALKPWALLEKSASWLAPGGKIALAGEPIQSIWWRNWGLRLDLLSVYCMRKFGWFESGWSKSFITDMLSRCGLSVSFIDDADPEIGPILIAARAKNSERKELAVEQIGATASASSLTSQADASNQTPVATSNLIAGKIEARIRLLRQAATLVRQAFSLSFLFRK